MKNKSNKDRIIDFLFFAKYLIIFSTICIIAGVSCIIYNKGFKMGVDFAGGKEIRLSFAKESKVSRELLEHIFTSHQLETNITEVQSTNTHNNEYFLYYPNNIVVINDQIKTTFNKQFGKNHWQVLSESFVGPKIGKQFQLIGIYSTVVTLVLLLIYIALRFQIGYGLAALISLIHDILIVLCFISFFNISFDIPILAAILTIIGYSLNDTIVIFDRIRSERSYINTPSVSLERYQQLVNVGINKSLSRTFLTSGTTLTVLIILYCIGSLELKPMTFILIIGVIIGTLSSNFIAPPFLKIWYKNRSI